jgi:hypothetical protein
MHKCAALMVVQLALRLELAVQQLQDCCVGVAAVYTCVAKRG